MAPTSEKTRNNDAKSKRPDATKTNDSSTRVNYPQSVFSGVRKTKGFKCDTGLYAAFKPIAQHYFGSVCHPLECFMLAVLTLQKERVNFGETVVIESLSIERNLRPRRNLLVDTCSFRGCKELAVASGIWRNKTYRLCEVHLQEAKSNSRHWKLISGAESSGHSSE